MIRNAMTFIAELTKLGTLVDVHEEDDGRRFWRVPGRVPEPLLAPAPPAVELQTLDGLAAVLLAEHGDTAPDRRPLVIVANHTTVEVVNRVHGPHHQRGMVYRARNKSAGRIADCWMDQADMVTVAQTNLAPSDDRSRLLTLVGTIEGGREVQAADDGVTQVVTVREGVARLGLVTVGNPFRLAPWRTFSELEQPTSPYVLRIRQRDDMPSLRLLETGDPTWQLTARERIQAYLQAALGDGWVVVR